MRDLDGPGPEGFPYEGTLRGIKEGFNVGRPHFLGVKHPLWVLSGKVLDDRGKRFRTNLAPEHTKLVIGLENEKYQYYGEIDNMEYTPEEPLHHWHGCCQGHSSLDAPSELNPPQRIPSPLLLHY